MAGEGQGRHGERATRVISGATRHPFGREGVHPRMLDALTLRLLATLLSCVCAAATSLAQSASPAPQPLPNIVIIVSDDHGWEDYGFMRHRDVRTPSIDTLASEGLVFTRGYVPTALCRPSLASLVTGLHPHQHGITGNDPPAGVARDEMVRTFARTDTLMSRLRAKGYVSLQTGKWWEGNPRERGFTASMTHGDVSRGGRHGDEGLAIGREGLRPIYDFIESAGTKPFFVWYAPMMPHTPHTPPQRLLEKYQRPDRPLPVARYYAMVEWFDETVGALMDHLDRRGLRDNTVVFYLADNGWLQATTPAGQPQTRGKLTPYEAGVRTPIVMRWPGRVKPGHDDRTLVSSLDIAPTILRVLGLDPPAAMAGLDLRDREGLARRRVLFGSLFAHTAVDVTRPVANLKYRTVLRDDGWKLILPYEPNRNVAQTMSGATADWMRLGPELYNVRDDPRETRNRAGEQPEIVRDLRGLLDGWWSVPEDRPRPPD